MPDPYLLDSSTVDLSTVGTPKQLKADVKVSTDPRNAIETDGSGLLVPFGIPTVTTLPGSPVDGDQILLTNATDGINWPMRYVAAIPGWIPAGGSPFYNAQDGQGTIASSGGAAWLDLSATDTAGPTWTVRWAGSYLLEWGAEIGAAVDGQAARMGIGIAGADPTTNNVVVNSNTRLGGVRTARPFGGLSVGNVLKALYNTDASSGTAQYQRRRLLVSPRVLTP